MPPTGQPRFPYTTLFRSLVVTACVFLSTVLLVIPLQGQVPAFLGYDGFNETFINPDRWVVKQAGGEAGREYVREVRSDRKSTRLNSSHSQISYAVFCLKK